MGAQGSKKRKFVRNIEDGEVDAFYAKFKGVTDGKEKMTREQFMKTYHDVLGDYAGQFYIRLAQKDPTGCLHMKPLLRTIDNGLSHFDVLAETLLLLFGDTKEEIMRNVVKIFCECNKFTREDQVRLYEYFSAVNGKPTEQLQNFFSECPLFAYTAQYIYARLLDRPGDSKMPKLVSEEETAQKSEILGRIDILIVNSNLPFDRRKSWTLLYSNSHHGHSFSQMSKRISGSGPVLVVIRSAKGRRFGFFANHGFVMGPQYHGTAECFLFQVAPRLSVFTATGRTENYAYLNAQQQQMPNGMGLCGQDDVWPIFLHEDFATGVCQKNSRFFEPCHVADEEEFKIKTIEVWRPGEKPQKSFEEQVMSSPEKSIIDRDPEAKAILEMAGRSMKSEAFREPKPLLADE